VTFDVFLVEKELIASLEKRTRHAEPRVLFRIAGSQPSEDPAGYRSER